MMPQKNFDGLRKIRSCTPLINSKGEIKGFVCVLPNKDLDKLEIIHYDKEKRNAKHISNVTELMNILAKDGLNEHEIIRVTEFVSERLRALNKEKRVEDLSIFKDIFRRRFEDSRE